MARRHDMRPVFLSASLPSQDRASVYYTTANVIAVREAVIALARIVLVDGLLVFGGHPAISGLVLAVASPLSRTGHVRIYQSRYFENAAPAETTAFPDVVWVNHVPGDLDASLLLMRRAMIERHDYRAGVFIGGMDGVEREFDLFVSLRPGAVALPIGTTGAAAQRLVARAPHRLRSRLASDRLYDVLFGDLLP